MPIAKCPLFLSLSLSKITLCCAPPSPPALPPQHIAKYILDWFLIFFTYPFPSWSLVLRRSHSVTFPPIFHYFVGFLPILSILLQVIIHLLDLIPLNTHCPNYGKYNFSIYTLVTSDLEKFQTSFTVKSSTSSIHLIVLMEFIKAFCLPCRNTLWTCFLCMAS